MTQPETNLRIQIQRALGSRPDVRLFRNAVGLGYVGKLDKENQILLNPVRMPFGLGRGTPDLIGWHATRCPVCNHGPLARFAGLEVKTAQGRASKAQRSFLTRLAADGGVACFVRSIEEAENALGLH